MRRLEGKTALVTGASRGIGRGIAERLAGEGALVAVHYRSNEAAAQETARRIREAGGSTVLVAADLAGGRESVAALYGELDGLLTEEGGDGRLDILVNNAAIAPAAPIDAVTPGDLDELLTVNTKAVFYLVQQGVSRLRDGGRVINISSRAARTAFPEAIAYAMSKGAVDSLTIALAKALAGRRITVNTVAPGWVETDMNLRRRRDPGQHAQLAAASVFNRIGRPSEIAAVVAFLASDDGSWVTGQWLDASGGSAL